LSWLVVTDDSLVDVKVDRFVVLTRDLVELKVIELRRVALVGDPSAHNFSFM
jgi:hypothetical protein